VRGRWRGPGRRAQQVEVAKKEPVVGRGCQIGVSRRQRMLGMRVWWIVDLGRRALSSTGYKA
jgi:hypothetical protein